MFWATMKEGFQSIPGISKDIIPDAIKHYNRHYAEVAQRKVRLFPGIYETLNILKYSSIPLAIATNESRANLEKLTASLNIESFFNALRIIVINVSEIGIAKAVIGTSRATAVADLYWDLISAT